MQKFPLHLPHKVFLAGSSRPPPSLLSLVGRTVLALLICWFQANVCKHFPYISHPHLARSLDDCHHVQCPQWIISSVAASCRFSFSFSLLCVCVVIADISCSAVAAASIRHASTFVSLIASVCISIKPFSCPHMHSYICMYQYVEQPLISHLSWRFINSRLKINWNFIHLIILFTRSLFSLFMNQYCGIHLNCMWL